MRAGGDETPNVEILAWIDAASDPVLVALATSAVLPPRWDLTVPTPGAFFLA